MFRPAGTTGKRDRAYRPPLLRSDTKVGTRGADIRVDDGFVLGKIFPEHVHELARHGIEGLLIRPRLARIQKALVNPAKDTGT